MPSPRGSDKGGGKRGNGKGRGGGKCGKGGYGKGKYGKGKGKGKRDEGKGMRDFTPPQYDRRKTEATVEGCRRLRYCMPLQSGTCPNQADPRVGQHGHKQLLQGGGGAAHKGKGKGGKTRSPSPRCSVAGKKATDANGGVTPLCASFSKAGKCPYGEQCLFSHSPQLGSGALAAQTTDGDERHHCEERGPGDDWSWEDGAH